MADLAAMIRRDVPPEHVRAHAVALAEHVGQLWIVEDLGWSGAVAQAGPVLTVTESGATGDVAAGHEVVVGHGVAPAPLRNPTALAMEWATLARMFPGRLLGGVGHGVIEWMQAIGSSPASRLALLRETVQAIRGLLRGETVALRGQEIQLDGVALVLPPEVVPPVSLGVAGPRSLRLSGEVADGTILAEGSGPTEVSAARTLIDEGRATAGRTDPHRLTVFVGYWSGDPARRPPPPQHIGDRWSAVSASVDEAVEQLAALVTAGADDLVLVPFGDVSGRTAEGGEAAVAQVAAAAADVAPQLPHR